MKRLKQVAAAAICASLLLLALLAVALPCSMLLAGIVGTWRGMAW